MSGTSSSKSDMVALILKLDHLLASVADIDSPEQCREGCSVGSLVSSLSCTPGHSSLYSYPGLLKYELALPPRLSDLADSALGGGILLLMLNFSLFMATIRAQQLPGRPLLNRNVSCGCNSRKSSRRVISVLYLSIFYFPVIHNGP